MFSQQYKQAINNINGFGFISEPRGQKVYELLGYSFYLDNPMQCMAGFEYKEFNFKYLLAELLWYMSLSTKTDFIGQIASLWTKISQDGRVNSNYGYLVFGNKGTPSGQTQFIWAFNSLKNDKDSRQAIIHYNKPIHQYNGNTDFVCTVFSQFFIRDNKLYYFNTMRSNDLLYGTTYDLVWASIVHQTMYLELKKIYPELQIGGLDFRTNSLHYYEKDLHLIEKIIKSNKNKDYIVELNDSILGFINSYEVFNEIDLYLEKKKELTNEDCKNILKKYNINIYDYNVLMKS